MLNAIKAVSAVFVGKLRALFGAHRLRCEHHAPHMLLGAALALIPGLLFGSASVSAQTVSAGNEVSWLRYPAISPDGSTLAFTYRGDLYTVPAAGGQATQLTQHQAEDMMPVWSPDGRQLVFASNRHGNFDLFVMPAAGGEAVRLTFHSADEFPYSFTPDGKSVVFGGARGDAASNRQFPTAYMTELWKVPVSGGRPLQLLTTPAEDARYTSDGKTLLYHDRKGSENAWRKHHTSAITRDIWAMNVKSGALSKLSNTNAETRTPIPAENGRTIYYLSEASGTFNVHKMNIDGSGSQQLTSYKGSPVRFLSMANDGTLAFGHDGQLYTMRAGQQPKHVAVQLRVDAKANDTQVLSVSNGARELVVSPNGKELAFTYRGDVFVASVEGGVTKRITATPGQESGLSFSPDGKAIAYASERNGHWGIYEVRRTRDAEPYFYASTVLREQPLVVNQSQNRQPDYSPDGKELAYVADRTNLRVRTLDGRATRTLLDERNLWGTQQRFQWSPDGKWMLFDMSVPGIAPGEVGLVATDGKSEAVNLTQSGFNDGNASWILGGEGMLWFSDRDGLKSVAQSGSAQRDVYGMFFTKEAWDRYRLSKEELALVKDAEGKANGNGPARTGSDSSKAAAVKPVVIDLKGIDERKARLTIHSSSLGDALVSKDGETLYYLARFERGSNLWTTNLRTRETRQLVALNANSGSMTWDKDQKNIFLVADGSISKIDPSSGKRESVPIRGEMVVDLGAERAEAFEHVWQRTHDTFYTAGFHGANWDALKPEYSRFLPHIGNDFEFAELLAEMLGELNISHSGARWSASGSDLDATAALGVLYDPTWTAAGARIDEVLPNGPLDQAGMNITVGSVILSVDGETITADTDIAQLLNRKAGRNVLLVVSENGASREIVAKPVSQSQEGQLLYTRWVKRNRDEVERLSNGRLGYIHIPGMNDGAMRSTFEDVMGRYALKDGLVVDTRNNGGGDLVADLAMFLSGQRFFSYSVDNRSSGFEPNFRWTKPSIALANEANYSDGHCFAYTYQHLKIGTLVGMPVPGTCTFAGWENIQGGIRWGVPGLGVKAAETGRYLENHQTEPDVKVMNEYDKVAGGQDQQLEAAVAKLLEELKR